MAPEGMGCVRAHARTCMHAMHEYGSRRQLVRVMSLLPLKNPGLGLAASTFTSRASSLASVCFSPPEAESPLAAKKEGQSFLDPSEDQGEMGAKSGSEERELTRPKAAGYRL